MQKRRPGFLTQYALHAEISVRGAAEQLKRVGIDYFSPFDFAEADRLRAAARHADRAKFTKPIYVKSGDDPLGDDSDGEEQESSKDPAFAKSQARKEEFRAKLVELEYEERVGTLVRKEEVEKEMFRIGRQVRDSLLNVPARLAGILAAESDQRKVHDLLESEIRQSLEVLAVDDTDGAVPNQESRS